MESNANDDPNQIDFANVPIRALSHRARSILSRSLNPVKVLLSEQVFPRDWRGIAHLAGLQGLYGPAINAERDPMAKVLSLWCTDGDNQTANFDSLVKFLGAIDRWDVADDLCETLVEDAQAYKSKKHRNDLLDQRQGNANAEVDISVVHRLDVNILTKDDVERAQQGLPPQTYDAFVLFAEEDINFVTELIERLEEDHPKFGFKLCLKDRDLIGGVSFEHEAVMRLISERCNRVIVIISVAFLKSSVNAYFTNYAVGLQIEERRLKIVPCLYDNSVLPLTLSFHHRLQYRQTSKLFNFWEKLSYSIRSTNVVSSGDGAGAPPSIQVINSHTQDAEIAKSPTVATGISTTGAPVKQPHTNKTKEPAIDPMKMHSKPKPKSRSAFSKGVLNYLRITRKPVRDPLINLISHLRKFF